MVNLVWRSHILHSLGLAPPMRRWSYRNYFCVSYKGKIYDEFLEMEKQGLVFRGKSREPENFAVFHVTKKGAEYVDVVNRIKKEDRYLWENHEQR